MATAVQTTAPWDVQQPYLQAGFQQAASNLAGNPFQLPGFGQNTQQAINSTAARAQAGSPLLQAGQQAVQGAAQGNYLNANPASGFYNSLMTGGQVNPALGLAGGMARQTSSNPAIAMLQQSAGGSMLNSNPYVDQTYNRAAGEMTRNFREAVAPGIDSAYARAGRVGSNSYATARNTADRSLGTALGDLATNIYGGNYANERQLQQAAQGQIGQFSNADQAQRLAAINQYGTLGQQGITNMGAGALGLGGAWDAERARQQQAALNAPQMAAADYADPNALLQVGQLQDKLAQANAALTDPNARLAQYMDMVRGSYGGTQNQSSTANSSTLANVIGGGLGLAQGASALFGQQGAFPNAFSSVTGLLGGGGGASSLPNASWAPSAMGASDLLKDYGSWGPGYGSGIGSTISSAGSAIGSGIKSLFGY